MKFTSVELKDLMSASYGKAKDLKDVGKFILDRSLSNHRVQVYTYEDECVVIHRGSKTPIDWVDNSLFANFNALEKTTTYKMHYKKHKIAYEKYAFPLTVIGHSRGALYAKSLYDKKMASSLITYNKPVNGFNVISGNFTKAKKDKNETNIRTSRDIVSIGQTLLPQENVTIKSDTYNPVAEHSTDNLLKLNMLVGTGMKMDFKGVLKADLRAIVKKYTKIKGIRSLSKGELIDIISELVLN
jgi:hypothetical protein